MNPATPIAITTAALSSSLAFAQPPFLSVVQAQKNEEGGKEMRGLISNPQSPSEVIRNIKYIFDHDLVLSDEFFKKQYVCGAFSIALEACEPSKTNEPDGTHGLSLHVDDFVGIFPKESFSESNNGSVFSGLRSTGRLSIWKKITESGAISGGIHLILENSGPDVGPNFDETMKILNLQMKIDFPMPLHSVLPPPITGPHGNETWKYEAFERIAKKTLVAGFDHSGRLYSILIEITKIGEQQ